MCFQTFITLNTDLINTVINCAYRNATVGVIDLFIFIDLSAVFAFLKIIANLKKNLTVEETHKI